MRSLALIPLEVGRLLVEKGSVIFRARGTCMYPSIRPGDVLTVQPCSVADMDVGDIAVCRSPDFFFGHRVIDKGECDGRGYIITKADREGYGNDQPTFDDNLLGIVKAITRKGKCRQAEPKRYPPIISYYHLIFAFIIDLAEHLKHSFIHFFAQFTDSIFYRIISRTWYEFARPGFTYAVRVPLNATLGDEIYQKFDPEKFDPENSINGKKLRRWILAAHVNGANDPGAWIAFTRHRPGEWRAEDSYTRLRYRGINLQEKLMSKAKTIF